MALSCGYYAALRRQEMLKTIDEEINFGILAFRGRLPVFSSHIPLTFLSHFSHILIFFVYLSLIS